MATYFFLSIVGWMPVRGCEKKKGQNMKDKYLFGLLAMWIGSILLVLSTFWWY